MQKVERKETQLLSEEKLRAVEEIKRWCAYQERSHFETYLRCRKAGFSESLSQQILSDLIAGNFINEERFAKAFAGGKFRMKKWGKLKILRELKSHRVSESNIREALESIDQEDYLRSLEFLCQKKMKDLKGKNQLQKKASLYRFLIGKGYEAENINAELQKQFNDYES